MKLLFTGSGTSGSFQIRAQQVGAALGARVVPMATAEDCRAADLVVVVKRVPEQLLLNIRRSGRPWVYDIVDAYPQPACSAWTEGMARAWLKEHLRRLKPDFVIWPTARMQADGGGGGAVIYHHHRPGIEVNPIRDRLEVIGYEGAPAYLAGWRLAIELECKFRGMRFVVNPPSLADVDVVLALRGTDWNGYAQRHWKSNVKLANAHASGTPFIGAPECGYEETATGLERWATQSQQLGKVLDRLESQAVRRQTAEVFRRAAYPLQQAAARYREVLCALKS